MPSSDTNTAQGLNEQKFKSFSTFLEKLSAFARSFDVYNQPSAFLEYVRTMKRVDIQIDDVIAFFISLVHQSSTTTDVQNHQQMIDYRSGLIDAVESLGDIDWTPASSRLPKRSGGGVVSDHEPTSAYSLDNSDEISSRIEDLDIEDTSTPPLMPREADMSWLDDRQETMLKFLIQSYAQLRLLTDIPAKMHENFNRAVLACDQEAVRTQMQVHWVSPFEMMSALKRQNGVETADAEHDECLSSSVFDEWYAVLKEEDTVVHVSDVLRWLMDMDVLLDCS